MANIDFDIDTTKEPEDPFMAIEEARDKLSQEDYSSLESEVLNGSLKDFITRLDSVEEPGMLADGRDFIEDVIMQYVELVLIESVIVKEGEE